MRRTITFPEGIERAVRDLQFKLITQRSSNISFTQALHIAVLTGTYHIKYLAGLKLPLVIIIKQLVKEKDESGKLRAPGHSRKDLPK